MQVPFILVDLPANATDLPTAPAEELDIELKRKWFDAPNLDFAHIYAGISKHLRVHMSPIGIAIRARGVDCIVADDTRSTLSTENTAVQRLWERTASVDEVTSAMLLHERCWLQRGRHGQHRPFSEELSATAFNVWEYFS